MRESVTQQRRVGAVFLSQEVKMCVVKMSLILK